ncbi:DUF6313 family protein [Streptomyces sp. NPDC057116]|uniref:DUF6313 family protein n=1 Tax=Streptomyces sp. NPDC057116 TaxID=3346023 RepID=UPI00362FFDE9
MNVSVLNNLAHWLVTKARWFIVFTAVLFVIECLLVGFSDAWELLVGRASPKDAPYPWCSWPLSVVGWALVPAFIGGVVGYVVSSGVESRRRGPRAAQKSAAMQQRGRGNEIPR